ncbi:hypothetical protein LTR10_010570 [Elasticomyces elasticus]|nr:hypothetical protein LTR10_010570 [Elasticomyces elasticus]KAK4972469.1 hypothetical protein LTR42_006979 [Elasticomyces elasticus]
MAFAQRGVPQVQCLVPVAQMLPLPQTTTNTTTTAAPAASSSAPSATVETERTLVRDNDIDHINFSLDWGTGTCSVAYTIRFSRAAARKLTIDNVIFQKCGTEPPTIFAVLDKKLIWGYDLERMIRNELIDEKDVFDLVKLELYPERDTISERRHKLLQEQFNAHGLSLDKLMTMHFEAIVRESVAHVCSQLFTTSRTYSADAVRKMDKRWRISAPQMWTMEALGRMQSAAKAANIDLAVMCSEPENALATTIHDILETQAGCGAELDVGEHILVIDVGRGTADIVMFKLNGALTTTSMLEPVSSSSGGTCGAQQVNELLLKKLESGQIVRREGSLQALLAKLGLTEVEWRNRALRKMDDFMRKYLCDPEYSRRVMGRNGTSFDIDRIDADIKEAFDQVLTEIKTITTRMINMHHPWLIFLSGGFSLSTYVAEDLKATYEVGGTRVFKASSDARGQSLQVSRGGLLRFDRIKPGNLPNRYGFAIVRDEAFDETNPRHWDGFESRPVMRCRACRDGDGEIMYDPDTGRKRVENYLVDVPDIRRDVVQRSGNDNKTEIVLDRLCVFFKKGTEFATDEPMKQEVWQEYYLSKEDPKLITTLVCISGEQQTHDPSGRTQSDSTAFGKGVHHFKTVQKTLSKELLEQYTFPEVKGSKGVVTYVVNIKKTLTYRGGHDMTVGLVLKVGEGVGEEIKLGGEETVWEANFSQFVDKPDSGEGDGEDSGGNFATEMEEIELDRDAESDTGSEEPESATSARSRMPGADAMEVDDEDEEGFEVDEESEGDEEEEDSEEDDDAMDLELDDPDLMAVTPGSRRAAAGKRK